MSNAINFQVHRILIEMQYILAIFGDIKDESIMSLYCKLKLINCNQCQKCNECLSEDTVVTNVIIMHHTQVNASHTSITHKSMKLEAVLLTP